MGLPPIQRRMGARIKQLRTKRDMTQVSLADRMCRGQATISEWESGLRWLRPDDLKKLARILRVTTQYIMLGM